MNSKKVLDIVEKMHYNKGINKKGRVRMARWRLPRIKKMRKFEMAEMKDFETANFEGFTLKKGF